MHLLYVIFFSVFIGRGQVNMGEIKKLLVSYNFSCLTHVKLHMIHGMLEKAEYIKFYGIDRVKQLLYKWIQESIFLDIFQLYV